MCETTRSLKCECVFCKGNLPFDMPPDLITKFIEGNVTLFVGAGVSTENRDFTINTLYDEIRQETGIKESPAFPDLMQIYCNKPDGRINLITKINNRFKYIESFPRLYHDLTRFHSQISSLYFIKDFVTTNWDSYLEQECMLDAFIYDSDIAFWKSSDRRLIKIHGSITNFGSLVATRDDYERSFNRLEKGTLGAKLKMILADSTVVYVGYSLNDDNYKRLHAAVTELLAPFSRQAYLISPYIEKSEKDKFDSFNVCPIKTDGTYFFEQLAVHAEREGVLIPSENFSNLEAFHDEVVEIHAKCATEFHFQKRPLVGFTLAYQDGLLDALSRTQKRKKSGEYNNPCRIIHLVNAYDVKATDYRKNANNWDAAYCDGYRYVLMYLLMQEVPPPKFYISAKVICTSMSEWKRRVRARSRSRLADEAKRKFAKLDVGFVPEHLPYV